MKIFKKMLLGLGILGLAFTAITPTFAEEPEEATQQTEEQVEEVKTGNVKIGDFSGGTVEVSATEGNVGDVVKITPQEHFLYTLKGIYVNGNLVTANENGEYEFAIVEGENKVTASFEVDDAKVKEVAKLIEGVRNGDWSNLLTVENLFKLIYFVLTFLLSTGLLGAFIKSKKYKVKTMDDLEKVVKSEVGINLTELVTDVIQPILNVLLDKTKSSDDKINTLTRAVIASISGDEASKIAILKDLQSTAEENDKKLTEQVQSIVEAQLKKKEVAKAETQEAIEQIKNDNNNLEVPHL